MSSDMLFVCNMAIFKFHEESLNGKVFKSISIFTTTDFKIDLTLYLLWLMIMFRNIETYSIALKRSLRGWNHEKKVGISGILEIVKLATGSWYFYLLNFVFLLKVYKNWVLWSPCTTFFRSKKNLWQDHMLDSHKVDNGEEADVNS